MTEKIIFHEILQDSQEYGSDDEHMVSRIFFTLEIGGKQFDLSTDIKQIVGSSFENAALEVSPPQNYTGPFNFEAFQKEVEEYYRESFGARGHAIHIEGASNIRMKNNRVIKQKVVEIEISNSESTSW